MFYFTLFWLPLFLLIYFYIFSSPQRWKMTLFWLCGIATGLVRRKNAKKESNLTNNKRFVFRILLVALLAESHGWHEVEVVQVTKIKKRIHTTSTTLVVHPRVNIAGMMTACFADIKAPNQKRGKTGKRSEEKTSREVCALTQSTGASPSAVYL